MPEQLVKLIELLDQLNHQGVSRDDFLNIGNKLLPEFPPQTNVDELIETINTMKDGYFYNLEN